MSNSWLKDLSYDSYLEWKASIEAAYDGAIPREFQMDFLKWQEVYKVFCKHLESSNNECTD